MQTSKNSLEEQVQEIINDFINHKQAFTALDVTNEALLTHPEARHFEVRALVKGLFPHMSSLGYTKTSIDVVLEDKSKSKAMLYHDLADSWDLDRVYDSSLREQKINLLTTQSSAIVNAQSLPPVNKSSTTFWGAIRSFLSKKF